MENRNITITICLTQKEYAALVREVEEMKKWYKNVPGEKMKERFSDSEYTLEDAAEAALFDGIQRIIRNQRLDDQYRDKL